MKSRHFQRALTDGGSRVSGPEARARTEMRDGSSSNQSAVLSTNSALLATISLEPTTTIRVDLLRWRTSSSAIGLALEVRASGTDLPKKKLSN